MPRVPAIFLVAFVPVLLLPGAGVQAQQAVQVVPARSAFSVVTPPNKPFATAPVRKASAPDGTPVRRLPPPEIYYEEPAADTPPADAPAVTVEETQSPAPPRVTTRNVPRPVAPGDDGEPVAGGEQGAAPSAPPDSDTPEG